MTEEIVQLKTLQLSLTILQSHLYPKDEVEHITRREGKLELSTPCVLRMRNVSLFNQSCSMPSTHKFMFMEFSCRLVSCVLCSSVKRLKLLVLRHLILKPLASYTWCRSLMPFFS